MDFSWALTLPREQISTLLAGRLAGAMVMGLGLGPSAAGAMRSNVQVAGGYLVMHSHAPAFRVVLSVSGIRCRVDITDQAFTHAGQYARINGRLGSERSDHHSEQSMIHKQLAIHADAVEVHHSQIDGILLRFQIPLLQANHEPQPEA
ncbi:hypothetical protein [Streptomyces sp. HUAS TT7]|uniref:hypothetical protein n=1 Tax=Streptomyces sp. HUAS TT7 TaxID=3447507 RepID=UPI003F659C22